MYWLIHDERSPLIWIDFTSLITSVKLYGTPALINAHGPPLKQKKNPNKKKKNPNPKKKKKQKQKKNKKKKKKKRKKKKKKK
ncbi:hypothetical protein, partial [Escherichia coli]|uniref:hypothetical protein n=1 Tax=Escherichia coli TaxID=562 RepID=UPI0010CB5DDB